ncbi:MAG: B12-binding domain-containing radical SAM protein [Desulfobacterales bacterium]|jgi:radical SAM superfamily enzyme YgiQ (UPF0313 family)|nr:B12-binding domain-containing radical SAM protein [Desulfobacterales bacterium]
MKTLLLINPIEKKRSLGAYKSSSTPPLSLAYLAALTPEEKYRITIIDENIEPLNYPDADIVGITSYTAHVRRAYEIAQFYRKKSIPVVMGGVHVSALPDEALKYCDAVVIGEAESVWVEVLKDFENNCLKSKYPAERLSLEHIPFPKREYLKNDLYLWGTLLTSRGCPMDCSFCSVTQFNGHSFRRRLIGDVISELMQIKQKFVMIVDDNILGHENKSGQQEAVGKEWLRTFFRTIIQKKIKKYFYIQASLKMGEDVDLVKLAYKAGVRVVLLGIESIELDSLKSFDKHLNAVYIKKDYYLQLIRNIRKSGLAVLGCFILGGDSDTRHTFQKTLDFIFKARIDIVQITRPTPLPGTKFYQQLYNQNRIIDTQYPDAWQHYTFTRMLFKPKLLSIEDVYQGIHYIRKKYYSYWAKKRRFLYTLLDTKSITTTFFMLVLNRTYEKSFYNSDIFQNYDMSMLNQKFNLKIFHDFNQ